MPDAVFDLFDVAVSSAPVRDVECRPSVTAEVDGRHVECRTNFCSVSKDVAKSADVADAVQFVLDLPCHVTDAGNSGAASESQNGGSAEEAANAGKCIL